LKARYNRLGSAVLAAAAALVVAGALPASAHSVESHVSLDVSDRTVRRGQVITFFGKLTTEAHKRRCQRGAEVHLIRKGTGPVATDTTDNQGEFSFRIDPRPNRGRYFARYEGSGRFGYNNQHRCEADESRVIRIRRAGDN
jgi:hypothetical protein